MNMVQMKLFVVIFGIISIVTLAGNSLAEAALEVPDTAQLNTLANKTILDFALAVKAKDFTGFYRNISQLWQEQTTKEDLLNAFATFTEQEIDLTGLQGYDPVFTQQPYVNDDGWLVLQGNYPTRPSITYFTLKYVYEDAWKLVGVDLHVKPAETPSEDKSKQLANDTMLDFALAVKAKDFAGFYANISRSWQEQTTKEELLTIFQSFVEQEIDLTVLDGVEPVFDKDPYIDEDGLLVLVGYYPTHPSVILFELSYVNEEAAEWKLFGINVNVVPEEELTAKDDLSDVELAQLTNATMMDFASAVKAGDFAAFYQHIANLWQEQTTPEDLTQAFSSFSEQGIDLTVLDEYEPVFTTDPAFDEHDWLVLEGHYPTQPSVVHFKLKYAPEDSEWKLVGINVNIE